MTAFSSAGKSAYNGATLVLRRAVSNGWGFDFNYTLSHSLDNASSSESDGGTTLQDAFNPDAFRGPSNFDYRQIVTANAVVEMPFSSRAQSSVNGAKTWPSLTWTVSK